MINFNDQNAIPLQNEKSLLEVALDNKIELNHSCGGYGTCGTCRVIIGNHSDLPTRNPIELEMASDRGFSPEERLACQTKANQPLTVRIP